MKDNKYKSLEKLQGKFSEETLQKDLKKEYQLFIEDDKVYIWGTGQLGKFAKKQFMREGKEIIAFIDNNASLVGTKIEGIKVIRPDMVDSDHVIIICTKAFAEIEEQIEKSLVNPYLYYGILPFLDSKWESWGIALPGMLKKLDTYRKNYIGLFSKCADESSRAVLDSILSYRFTLKRKYLEEAYAISISGGGIEYFDSEIVIPQKDEVFVDCGGYIGDTVLGFLEFTGKRYKRIYYLEPNAEIYQKAMENLKGIQNVSYILAGVGEKAGVLKFSGMADYGHIDENGNERISIVTLDEVIGEKSTFIKMDIEGAELSALKGASNIIRESQPKLAICVYHKPEDLYEILEYVDSLGVSYKYYFRHYTKGITGTILYCIPENYER